MRTLLPPLPLFQHAEAARVRALPLPAKRLATRFALPAATAQAIAELAGFSIAGDR